MNDKPPIQINAPGIDTEAIVNEIKATVARKAEQGAYNDAGVARAERANLVNLKNDDEFLTFYLKALREAAFIDINDYPIRERRARLAFLLVRVKKTIWSLLKFYTYRMWTQQNMVNGLFVTGLESMHEQNSRRIKQLEDRIAELERKLENR